MAEKTYIEGLIAEPVQSVGSLFGIEKSPSQQRWEADNPISATTVEIASYLAPYGGWAKASEKIPALVKTMDKYAGAAKVAESPFLASAAREAIRYTPFELGRMGIAATISPAVADALNQDMKSLTDLGKESVIDLAGMGVIGGAFGKLASYGSKIERPRLTVPGQKIETPGIAPQEEMRSIFDQLKNGEIQDSPQIQGKLNDLSFQIRNAHTSRKSFQYVGDLEAGAQANHVWNRLFRAKDDGLISSLRTVQTTKPGTLGNRLGADVDPKSLYDAAGLDFRTDVAYMQEPRLLVGKNEFGTKIISNAVKHTLKPIDTEKGMFMSFDKADNLWLVAKRVGQENDNKWLMFKTDTPDRFAGDRAEFINRGKAILRRYGRTYMKHVELPETPGAITNVYNAGVRELNQPMVDFRNMDARGPGLAKQATDKILERTGLDKVVDKTGAVRQNAADLINRLLTPRMFQARNSPLALHALRVVNEMKDVAARTADRLFAGEHATVEGNIYAKISKSMKTNNSAALSGAIDKVFDAGDEVVKQFNRAVLAGMAPDEAAANGFSQHVVDLLSKLNTVDKAQTEGILATAKALGINSNFQPKDFHYMLSRTWRGDSRVPITIDGDKKRIWGYGSGNSHAAAEKHAAELIKFAQENGLDKASRLSAGNPFTVGELDQEIHLLQGLNQTDVKNFGRLRERLYLSKASPKRMAEERHGAHGYIGEQGFTREEVKKLVHKQLNTYQTYNAKISAANMLKPYLDKLAIEDPRMAELVADRIGQMFGQQGPIEKTINKYADMVLAPVMGNNSASKISSAMNKYAFRMQLGFVNVGFNMANMLSFVQTAWPHISWLTSAPPPAIAKYYTAYPLRGGLKPMGGVNVLDMFKITRQSFAEMGKPDALLLKNFERAAGEGVWDPRFIEEFVGQKAGVARNFKSVVDGKTGLGEYIGAWADLAPGASEKFARAQAFTMGHVLFRDVFKVTDEELLYRLSKEFVEKTQYAYSAADRAAIFTGPLGSSLGLFKNWLMHYMGWTMQYAGEGFSKGNWAPFLWANAGTAAVAGVGGTLAMGIADEFSKTFTDKSAIEHTYTAMHDAGAPDSVVDGLYYGLPSFLGISLKNQMSMPGADLVNDSSMFFSMALWDRVNNGMAAVESSYNAARYGNIHPADDRKTWGLLMRTFAPKNVYGAVESFSGSMMQSTRSARPTMDGNYTDKTLHMFGLDTIQAQKFRDTQRELWSDLDKRKAAVSGYGQQWAEAQMRGNQAEADMVMMKAMLELGDTTSVTKSGMAFLSKGKEDAISRQFTPEAIWEARRVGLLNDQGE